MMTEPARLRYEVRPADPAAHRGAFRLTVDDVLDPSVQLVFPSWVPGSYWIQDRVRNVSGMRATDPLSGGPLPLSRVGKARWRAETRGVSAVQFDWEVYGNEVRTSWFDLTPEHMFLDAGFALPFVEGRRTEPCDLTIEALDGWRVVTELPPVGPSGASFRAADYDELLDSPLDAGRFDLVETTASGIPHRIVLCGSGGNYDRARVGRDLAKMAEAAHAVFGEVPIPSYTFFFHLEDGKPTGLEHARSTVCRTPPHGFRPEKAYREFLRLAAHEYFHLYNVKRIRPAVYVDPDLERETYSRLLWAMEGTTRYFEGRLLLRAGLLSPARYLEELAGEIRTFRQQPGRLRQSLEEASFAAWVDFYHPYEETPNRSMSYYVKGGLVSLALDLETRARSGGGASLDSLWRSLWTTRGRVGRGIEEGELEGLLSEAAGFSLSQFFDRYVRGTDDLEFESFLAHAGLRLVPRPAPRKPDDGPAGGFLDIELVDSGGSARVSVVRDGGAARRAGLSPGDEIVAVDGLRARYADLPATLERYAAGDTVHLTVFRRGRLTSVDVTLGIAPAKELAIVPVAEPSDAARRVHQDWLGVPWAPSEGKP